MVNEGSIYEVSLWETQSLSLLNSPAAGSMAGNIPAEETNDVPPPPAALTSSQKRGRDGGSEMNKSKKAKKDVSSEEHDNHILTERERRKRMKDMFENLHALLPRLTKKTDKSSIVDEAVSYIRSLESTLHALESAKQQRQQQSATIFPHQTGKALPPYTSTGRFDLCDQEGSSIYDVPTAASSFNSSSQIRVPVGFQIWTSSNVVLSVCGDEAQFTVCSSTKIGVLSAIFSVMDKYKIDVMAANISADGKRSIYMIQARLSEDHLMEVEDIYRKASDEIMQWISTESKNEKNRYGVVETLLI